MPPRKICITKPHKLGDALYAWPIARWLAGRHGCRADFVTSPYCEPLRSLALAQSWCSGFGVAEHPAPGREPWEMAVPDGYEQVYHLGFRALPDGWLVDWMAATYGAPQGLPVQYDFPRIDIPGLPKDFAAVAPRGDFRFAPLFRDLARRLPCVQMGRRGEAIPGAGLDLTGMSFLGCCSVLDRAKAFVGHPSSLLVLANGFDLPRIMIQDGGFPGMQNMLQSQWNHYLVRPGAEDVLRIVQGGR